MSSGRCGSRRSARAHVAAFIAKQADDFEASTVSRDVGLLGDILKTAKREELDPLQPRRGSRAAEAGQASLEDA